MAKYFSSLVSRSLKVWVNLPKEERQGVSFSIRKSYREKGSSDWKESKLLFPEDIAALIDILPKALDWAGTQVKSNKHAADQNGKFLLPEEVGFPRMAELPEGSEPDAGTADDDTIPW